MPDLDITPAKSSNMENWTETSVDSMSTDGVSEQPETEYTNDQWTTLWGYFNKNPELKSALILKSIWNVGKGYEPEDDNTRVVLDHIKGYGKENFEDILFNLDLIRHIGRDSFAEIMTENNIIINLKPLDPESIKIVFTSKGIIKRYEQITKIGDKVKVLRTFEPKEIFHLSNNRLADQLHGVSDIESLEPTILAELESFNDIKKVMHRQAKPFIIFRYKTDDLAKIKVIVDKIDKLREEGEDLHIPDDENILSYEVVQVNVSQVIMEWRNDIRNKFYRAIGLPQIMPGAGGQGTESDSKVIYLAFEQIVEREQRYIERQVWNQLNLKIKLTRPTSISNDMQTDEAKDANQGLAIEPADTKVGVGA